MLYIQCCIPKRNVTITKGVPPPFLVHGWRGLSTPINFLFFLFISQKNNIYVKYIILLLNIFNFHIFSCPSVSKDWLFLGHIIKVITYFNIYQSFNLGHPWTRNQSFKTCLLACRVFDQHTLIRKYGYLDKLGQGWTL